MFVWLHMGEGKLARDDVQDGKGVEGSYVGFRLRRKFNPNHRYMRKLLLIIAKYLPGKKYQLSFDFKNKVVWYRVPKAGLTSINELLSKELGKDYYYRSRSVNIFKKWTTFAVVRHPYDRFLSCYKDKVVNSNYFRLEDRSVDGFLDFIEKGSKDPHIMPQSELVPETPTYTFIFDKLFNYEYADKVWFYMITGIYPNFKHLNESGDKPELTIEQRKRIREIYKEDFKRFY